MADDEDDDDDVVDANRRKEEQQRDIIRRVNIVRLANFDKMMSSVVQVGT